MRKFLEEVKLLVKGPDSASDFCPRMTEIVDLVKPEDQKEVRRR